MTVRLGVDIGGTFTDVVCIDDSTGITTSTKVLTSGTDLSGAVLQGIGRLPIARSEVTHFVHGTTVGLNALLERNGARVALVTTMGFRDVYEIARANRPEIYNLFYRKPSPLIARDHIYEVRERTWADGTIGHPVDPQELDAIAMMLTAGSYECVAVVFLHSYRNPANERSAHEILQAKLPGVPILLSSDVCPEWREYERTSTTAISAYIAPKTRAYVEELAEKSFHEGVQAPLHLMQSSGGIVPAAEAIMNPAQALLSGPVGGLVGAAALGEDMAAKSLIAIDMGGTSFDVSLVFSGEVDMIQEVDVGGLPLLMQSANIKTVGAGGGSVAWADGRFLRVGPQSAGAYPGPVCYGNGGREPTVTDANLVLGRIDPYRFLGGSMKLDADGAWKAISVLSELLGLEVDRLAEGIVDVVNVTMANAIRALTIQRGLDPRDFEYVVAYGGAGPLHGADLAQELGIRRVLFPPSPGSFSAWGMLQADIRRDATRSYFAPLEEVALEDLRATFELMRHELAKAIQTEGARATDLTYVHSVDVRYHGQEHFLSIPVLNIEDTELSLDPIAQDFHRLYESRYGHSNVRQTLEVVNLRTSAWRKIPRSPAVRAGAFVPERPTPASVRKVRLSGAWRRTDIYSRESLRPGNTLSGPAIIEEPSCSILVPARADCIVDAFGNVIVNLPMS